jgi:DNA-binding transcriptional MerR regulator
MSAPRSRSEARPRELESWPPRSTGQALVLPPVPNKLLFRIGEVAELVGVKPHVLRYWEQELGLLRPMKTRGSHRQYRRRDVEIARMVRQLTEVEGYTAAGAKKKIAASLRDGAAKTKRPSLARELAALRDELTALLPRLDPPQLPRAHIEPMLERR